MTKYAIIPANKAIPVQYSAVAPVPTVNVSAATPLSMAQHHGKKIAVNAGGSISLSRAQCGDGFICIVVNNTGSILVPTLTGYAQGTLHNAFGLTGIARNGMATLVVDSPDNGVTVRVKAAGELI